MRTFLFDAAGRLVAIAAAALAAAVLLAPWPAGAQTATDGLTLAELKAGLDERDRAHTLGAVHLALSEVADGQAYVWRNAERQLTGVVRPTATFLAANRQLCRHVVLQLSLGGYRKSIEGIACRGLNGRWSLSG